MDLITSGKPIPGIKEIPDIVKEGEGSESARPERRKPWEIAAEKKQEGGSGDGLGARQEAMETKKGGVEA